MLVSSISVVSGDVTVRSGINCELVTIAQAVRVLIAAV